MSKYCPNCGSELEETAEFCGNCGQEIKINTNSSVNTDTDIVDKKANIDKIDNDTGELDKDAQTGFVLGILSIIAWLIPLFGFPITIFGIIYSSRGLGSTKNKEKATAGIVLSIIFLIVTFINSIIGAMFSAIA